LIKQDPQAAEDLADEFRGDIRATIDEIRRVVYELRPPALDELGLAAAVCSQAQRWSGKPVESGQSADSSKVQKPEEALRVVVETPDALPPLPAAVEVAAYRIIQEALANVAHHAHASQCMVRLSLTGQEKDLALQVEITDDGIGLNGRGQGLGLLSMRERAAELGGQWTVKSLPQGGTRVTATLPVS
jgi:signal transduction histidine kinase